MEDQHAYAMQACENLLPMCRDVISHVTSQSSVILHLPRVSGQRELLQFISRVVGSKTEHIVCVLIFNDFVRHDQINYSDIYRYLCSSAGIDVKGDPDNRYNFRELLSEIAARHSQRILLTISISGAAHNEHAYQFVTDIHHVLARNLARPGDLTTIVIDDYSLYFYENWRTQRNSRWDLFRREAYSGFSFDEFSQYLESVDGILNIGKLVDIARLSEEMYHLSGGHYGITIDLLSDLERRKWSVGNAYWAGDGKQVALKGDAVRALRSALEEDGPNLCSRALEFVEPHPLSASEPRLDQFLRRSGLLRSHSELTFVLNGGVLGTLVRDYSLNSNSSGLISKPQFSSGVESVHSVPDAVDDDFVVLHISDIHCGVNFPFVYDADGRARFPQKLDIVDALRKDIVKQGLMGRIDAIVISGDFATTGEISEFYRARDLIRALIERLEIEQGRLLLIGGNHDIQWEPGPSSKREIDSEVSRENLDTFFALMGKPGGSDLQSIQLLSRTGDRVLSLTALDSNFVESKAAGGVGFVKRATLESAQSTTCRNFGEDDRDATLNWWVTHHHVFPVLDAPVEKARKGQVTVMASASTLLQACAESSVEVLLHGHEHQPSITLSARWTARTDSAAGTLAVVGAGSIGAARDELGPFSRNHYFILQRTKDELFVRSRMIGDVGEGFVKHADVRVLFGKRGRSVGS